MTTKITSDNIDTTIGKGTDVDNNAFNIGLLGFKMAVNEGLTVFNLVDGVVDEFNDESGTDEAEGTNDYYCGTDDFYKNQTTPASYSAGFSLTSITEPDTSVAGTNPTQGAGTYGTFTVPTDLTTLSVKVWGSGGSGGYGAPGTPNGGGGGFTTANLAVSPSQSFQISASEGGRGRHPSTPPQGSYLGGFGGYGPASNCNTGGGLGSYANGGGLAGVFSPSINFSSPVPTGDIPNVYIVAGSGGGGGGHDGCSMGGAGGGLTGLDGTSVGTGEGGSQIAGGASGSPQGQAGGFLYGGSDTGGGNAGGAGYYGGGSGIRSPHGSGGGGSSYYGHPQVSCGSTEAGFHDEGGGDADPDYSPIASTASNPAKSNINIGGGHDGSSDGSYSGGDGYILLTGTVCATATSTTIVSTAFSSTSVPTNSRIVVFEENIDTPTLNTDIIASVSRDGGTTFTNATLTDSGYVTGSSGQRILTGQADISGQPSGQSMRWKLALANNTVKIHGVSLQWS